MKIKRTTKEFRLLVCGSRDWTDPQSVMREIDREIKESGCEDEDILIITGGADGVDSIAARYCQDELGIANAVFTAPWDAFRRLYGNPGSAGPTRNSWMLRWGRPTKVLALHPYIVNSRGTKNCVEQARKLKIPVRIVEK